MSESKKKKVEGGSKSEIVFSIEKYEEIKSKVSETMKDKKATEIRPAIYKWIGYKLNDIEYAIKFRDYQTLVDIAVEALATLEAYLQVMEERANKYRSRRYSNSYRRGTRYGGKS